MEFIFSNYPPVKTQFSTFSDTFYNLLPNTDELDIAVGYVTSDSLIELQKAVELNKVRTLNLIIGMHYLEKFTQVEYKTAMRLNEYLQDNHAGEVRLVTPFRFHGKMYSFQKCATPFAGLIGSDNLSSIVGNHTGVYEAALLISETPSLQQMKAFIEGLKQTATDNIAKLSITQFKSTNPLLEGQDGVSRVSNDELAYYKEKLSDIRFEIPIKIEAKSNLNAFFGKGRENMNTHVIKPRHWYESEIIVSKHITTRTNYPQAETPSASFYVITDDGWKFKCKVSGQNSKNFRSENDLRILGKWLKGRLENAGSLVVGEPVTQDVLKDYGRNTISLIKTTSNDLWYLDFGVNNA